MSTQNNPLRQYFRRPGVYLKLPSLGKFYDETVLDMPENEELPVYPMTAIDDITVKTPDSLFNGQALVEIIKSCIPAFKDPWKINTIDLDAILVAIRSASNNNGMDINSECPKCQNLDEYKLNLSGVLSGIKSPDYNQSLVIGDLSIYFKPLDYKDMNELGLKQFEMQRQYRDLENITDQDEKLLKSKQALESITLLTMETLAKTIKCIVTINGTEVSEKEYILDYLKNCDKNNYEKIKEFNTQLRESGEMKPLKIKCTNCSNEYEQKITLNYTDFFG